MRNILFILAVPIFLISCKNPKNDFINNEEVEYFEGNAEILRIKDFENGKRVIYYPNDVIFAEGFVNKKGDKTGWWEYFNEEGKLNEKREFININDKESVNQLIYFDREGKKILRAESFNDYNPKYSSYKRFIGENTVYVDFILVKDTISLRDPFQVVGIYYTPLFRNKNSKAVVVLDNKEIYFNDAISEKHGIKKDTFYSLTIDTINKKWFPEDDPDYTIIIGGWFKTKGTKTISGYLSEYYFDLENKHHERRVYFKKEVFVKDTL